VRGIRFKGQITELVNDQELWLGEVREPLVESSFAMTPGEWCNDCRSRNELNRMPGQDRFAPQRHRKVGLADAGRKRPTIGGWLDASVMPIEQTHPKA